MAWELANEPRCGADDERNLPRSPDGCDPELVTGWIDEMSTFIKELDPYHLVTWGGEGGFNEESDDWAYDGTDGGDFDAELALENIDFGTFHSYPDWWTKTVEWTNQWIRDHAESQRQIGKPVVHEEYGMLITTPIVRITRICDCCTADTITNRLDDSGGSPGIPWDGFQHHSGRSRRWLAEYNHRGRDVRYVLAVRILSLLIRKEP